ncbi:hypothetical protein ABEB36_013678 [Hypothenemus hampei]|uniref:Sensory neuron membrane protein 1 n=1 Tax=Hypothenemus hampei TaxID=57062 RepID=A0ABD1E4Y2_HYPHA
MVSGKKILYISCTIAALGVSLKFFLFDEIVNIGLRDQTALRKRNEIRGIYLKIPFPLDFKFYFFNVTNSEEIQKGAKPILKEIGPYCYDEYKEKVDVDENDTEDSLTYTPYDIFKFNENKSGTLRDDDYVTIIHPAIVGMVNSVIRDSPVFLSIISKAIPLLFNNPKTIFLTAKIKDILFNGIELNCSGKDFASSAVCGQLKTQLPGLKSRPDNDKIYLFSLVGSRNASLTGRIKILRGIKKSKDLGRLIEMDGKKKTTLWNSEQCNRFEGTDGWIFPPLLTPEEGLKSYSPDLCRNVKLNYKGDTVYKKVSLRIYETTLGDQTNDPNEKCYCRTPDTCQKKGIVDMSRCMGVPILSSLPHFYETDEVYLKDVDGLHPDKEKHGLKVLFEPKTATPLLAMKRMQFNIQLQPTKKIDIFSDVPVVLFPIFWIEESVDLEGPLLKKIQTITFLLSSAGYSFYAMVILGLAGMGAGAYMHFKNNRKSVKITSLAMVNGTNNNNNNNNNDNDKNGFTNKAMSGCEFDRY